MVKIIKISIIKYLTKHSLKDQFQYFTAMLLTLHRPIICTRYWRSKSLFFSILCKMSSLQPCTPSNFIPMKLRPFSYTDIRTIYIYIYKT